MATSIALAMLVATDADAARVEIDVARVVQPDRQHETLQSADTFQARDEDLFDSGSEAYATQQVKNRQKAWQYEMSPFTSGIVAIVLVVLLCAAFVYSLRAMRSDTSSSLFRIRCSNAWLSCLQFVVIILPLLLDTLRPYIPEKIKNHWKEILFWNAFSNADCYGTFVMYAFHMWYGCILACFHMVLWNFMFPGGVACIRTADCSEHTTYLMSETLGTRCTIMYAAVCVYAVLVSRVWIDTKRIYLLYMASLFIDFLDPNGDWTNYSPFFINWEFRPKFSNGGVWIPLTVGLGFVIRCPLQYWMPIKIMSRGRISYGCNHMLSEGIDQLLQENVHCYSLILNWAAPNSTNQAESIGKKLAKTQAELTHLKCLADESWWEFRLKRTDNLHHYTWFLELLSDIEKINQFILLTAQEAFTGEGDKVTLVHQVLETYIKGLVDVYSGILWVLIDRDRTAEQRKESATGGMDLADALLGRIMQEIRQLDLDNQITSGKARELLAFFHAAGMWTTAIKKALNNCDPCGGKVMKVMSTNLLPHIRTYFTQTIFNPEQHIYAVTVTSAWCIAFFFSAYYCNYKPAPATTLSLMVIDKTYFLLDILNRLGIRIVGVALGAVCSNFPAFIFCSNYTTFRNRPADVISYVVIFIMFWGLVMYGTIVGNTSAYTFQTWAGFGSVELLRPLMLHKTSLEVIQAKSFTSMIYTSSGMFILSCALVSLVMYRGFFSMRAVTKILGNALKDAQGLYKSISSGQKAIGQKIVNLQLTLTELADTAVASKQSAALASTEFSDDVLQVVLEQCKHTCAMADSLYLLQGDVAVDLTEVMSNELSRLRISSMIDDLQNIIQEENKPRRSMFSRQSSAVPRHSLFSKQSSANDSFTSKGDQRKKSVFAYQKGRSWNPHVQWHRSMKEASETRQLKTLAATWSFELTAHFINRSLEMISVFSQNIGHHQQEAIAQGMTPFHEVCEDIQHVLSNQMSFDY